ncbi:MAG: putative tyrosine-protein kinase in cps region [Candidatus Accumulibacter regalis]|jgi:capsular exopolysaccharide family|uniref:Putative tyrosine-protein kinase EpsB n=1 Tax=Accumulibacter regalis TaxID=522306 RepID=A0A011Q8B8_ACCRE|nr:polysaccharide biosynthesis tyrosine autokinase [Accumulibacter sp.]EXI85410.1 MAG: putative tyrosine-protein kinase in cps region [Candidatus Accumulibacter regalis]MBL8368803.1 polysaccharide biosynthesis tyrosine autokinase [Accumulibacter sp.]HRE70206.1 polysaccharide biosynthesis tyrosine autokinase [Accumulibacter sp.]HRE86427.1 polysaccharide biosynthesis tyrosine autokinase [Accumulibacter sp.]
MDNDQSQTPFNAPGVPGRSGAQAQTQSLQQTSPEDDDEGLALGEIIAVLMDYRWLIAAVTLFALVLGLAWVFVAKPIYRADGLLQVEEKSSGMGSLKALQPLLGDETSVSAELEILSSRMVLGRVVKKLKLDIVAVPRTFPLIGGALSRRYDGDDPNSPWLGLSSFSWGGDRIQVDSLEVPARALDDQLTLVAGDEGGFEVMDGDGQSVLKGQVGKRAIGQDYSIFVAQLKARPGTRFRLMKLSAETAVDDLRRNYSVKERGKKSSLLELSLTGGDPEQIGIVLDDIMNTYLRQNVERRSAEAEKTLAFLETQLPALKTQVDSAEAAYNNYRQSRGSLDLSLETQSVLKSLVEVENAAVLLKQERDELRQNFTPEHPRIQAVDNKLQRLNERRKAFDADVAALPDTQQTVLRLARDVEVSNRLYTELLNTAQQLRVSKAGTVGDVRIIDSAAVGRQPVGAKPIAILGIALLLGVLFSMVIIWLLRALRVVVEDPEIIESQLGLPVYATVPHSKMEIDLQRKSKSGVGELLAVSFPEDDAVESLRGLRTTLHFALLDAQRNSLLITGSSPGLGKSFISKNLGVVLAQVGKRVVIVDADLRRGHIHKEFGRERALGVSEYVAGQATLDAVLKTTSVANLCVVSTGQIPPNPSELLMHERFATLLRELGERFDTVIVDAPPVLAVSDAAIIGRHVGATLMVARSGKHPIRELEQAVKRLNQAGVEVKGFVFNDLNVSRQRYRYGYKGYVYRYSYKT